jgi:hypothetical protein
LARNSLERQGKSTLYPGRACYQKSERSEDMRAEAVRASSVSRHLTLNDAIEIWRRRSNGEAQHKIAAAYEANQGRISEILSGKRFPAAKRLAQNNPHNSKPAQQ